jgi:hypothetical protein
MLQTVQQHLDLCDEVRHLGFVTDPGMQELVSIENNKGVLRDMVVSAINSSCADKEMLTQEELNAELMAALDTFASYLPPPNSLLEAFYLVMSALHKQGRNTSEFVHAINSEV